MTGVSSGVEITMLADIPSSGSGLGSSSSITVGLLHALWAYQHQHVPAEQLADGACTIEIDRCGKRIGRQDQYIAALGGIQDLRFGPGDRVVAEELGLSAAERHALQEQVMLFYTGVTRSATTILRRAVQQRKHLFGGFPPPARPGGIGRRPPAQRRFGEGRDHNARKLGGEAYTGLRCDQLSDRYRSRTGCLGRCVGGEGHRGRRRGFLLVICPTERQHSVRESLSHMRELPVKLDRFGSRVVFNVMRDIWS